MMDNYDQDTALETQLVQGVVGAVEGRNIVVEFGGEFRACRRAAGCLLDPQEGDIVLVSLMSLLSFFPAEEEHSYVLTVLERAAEHDPVTLTLHDGALLKAENGRISMQAIHGISLNTPGSVDLSGERIDLIAKEGRWLIGSLALYGTKFEAVWKECSKTVGYMQSYCTTWVQHLGDSFRHVRNLDETHAANVRTLASESLYAQGKFVNHTASEVVKIDGREVHLG